MYHLKCPIHPAATLRDGLDSKNLNRSTCAAGNPGPPHNTGKTDEWKQRKKRTEWTAR
jgi:hypothetical protein